MAWYWCSRFTEREPDADKHINIKAYSFELNSGSVFQNELRISSFPIQSGLSFLFLVGAFAYTNRFRIVGRRPLFSSFAVTSGLPKR